MKCVVVIVLGVILPDLGAVLDSFGGDFGGVSRSAPEVYGIFEVSIKME